MPILPSGEIDYAGYGDLMGLGRRRANRAARRTRRERRRTSDRYEDALDRMASRRAPAEIDPGPMPQRHAPRFSLLDRIGRTAGRALSGDAVGALDEAVNYRRRKHEDADYMHQMAIDKYLERRKQIADINTIGRDDQTAADEALADALYKRGQAPTPLDTAEQAGEIATGELERRATLEDLRRAPETHAADIAYKEALTGQAGATAENLRSQTGHREAMRPLEQEQMRARTEQINADAAATTGRTLFTRQVAALEEDHLAFMSELNEQEAAALERYNAGRAAGNRREASEGFHQLQEIRRIRAEARDDRSTRIRQLGELAEALKPSASLTGFGREASGLDLIMLQQGGERIR